MEQFTKALFEKVTVLFVVVLAVFGVHSLFFRATLFGALPAEFTRFRQRAYLYFEIRERFQKRILAWLYIINGFSIAPVI